MKLQAKFTEFTNDTNWVSGTVGDCTFEAKLFDIPSAWGIDEGRVSKLSIKSSQGSLMVNYSHGWDVRPDKYAKRYFKAVMGLLENAPERF